MKTRVKVKYKVGDNPWYEMIDTEFWENVKVKVEVEHIE